MFVLSFFHVLVLNVLIVGSGVLMAKFYPDIGAIIRFVCRCSPTPSEASTSPTDRVYVFRQVLRSDLQSGSRLRLPIPRAPDLSPAARGAPLAVGSVPWAPDTGGRG